MTRFRLALTLLLSLLATAAQGETIVNVLSINRDSGSWKEIYLDMVKQFNNKNSCITVKLEFMEDEAFKQNLPTLLQSNAAPHLFYSWGGGVFSDFII